MSRIKSQVNRSGRQSTEVYFVTTAGRHEVNAVEHLMHRPTTDVSRMTSLVPRAMSLIPEALSAMARLTRLMRTPFSQMPQTETFRRILKSLFPRGITLLALLLRHTLRASSLIAHPSSLSLRFT